MCSPEIEPSLVCVHKHQGVGLLNGYIRKFRMKELGKCGWRRLWKTQMSTKHKLNVPENKKGSENSQRSLTLDKDDCENKR